MNIIINILIININIILTCASVGGDAADVVPAPGFHGDGVESARQQRGEDALVVSGGDALVLQDAVVVADQNHVAVQVSGRMAPVHLNTRTQSLTSESSSRGSMFTQVIKFTNSP